MTDCVEMLAEAAAEVGLKWRGAPTVRRVEATVDGQRSSALAWGEAPAKTVLLHGGGQNAHTWDTVMLALLALDPEFTAIAIDLPGHGHSSWRDDHDYSPWRNAEVVAKSVAVLAPGARRFVGMSLGGLTTIRLAATIPTIVRSAVIVDVTPSVQLRRPTMTVAQQGTTALVSGASTSFESVDQMVGFAATSAPRRRRSSLRRGVVHNSRPAGDGRWVWRYDPAMARTTDFTPLWSEVESAPAEMTLVRGGASAFVPDADADEFVRRKPGLSSIVLSGAGHSVQSDAPVELAEVIIATAPRNRA